MLPVFGLVREIFVTIIVIIIGYFIVTTLIKPSTVSLNEVLEGEYKYKYRVFLPEESLKLVCQNGEATDSNEIEVVLRFEPDSYVDLTKPLEGAPSLTEEDFTGVRIDVEGMVHAYEITSSSCIKSDADKSFTCKYKVEGVTTPKKFCKGSGFDEVPVYVSLWDTDKCESWSYKEVPLVNVYQICIEPGALRGFMKSSENLEVRW